MFRVWVGWKIGGKRVRGEIRVSGENGEKGR